MSAIFFKSKNVNIFPCARRGIYREVGSDKDNIYNPESRFVSEANLTKLSGLAFGRDSYIISRPTTVSEGGIWKLFIKGYYFELTIEKDELQEEGYFIIGLEDTSDISRIRLAALESSGSLISIDKGTTSLDADGRCRAICFISSDEAPSEDALYCVRSSVTLKALDESYANFSMSEMLLGIDARLDVLEGEGEGSVEKALIDANIYADGLNTAMDTRVNGLETAGAAQDTLIANNTQAIADEVVARGTAIDDVIIAFQGADLAINDKIGKATDGKEATTVYGAIAKAQAEAEAKVDTLAKGQVNTNKEAIEDLQKAISGSGGQGGSGDTSITYRVAQAEGKIDSLEKTIGTLPTGEDAYHTLVDGIAAAKKAGLDAAQAVVNLTNGTVATNAADIADLKTRVGIEEKAREDGDKELDDRLKAVEAFFVTKKDEEGNDIALDEALDTLVEIQEYITGDGAAAKDMLDAIEALQNIVKDGGSLEVRVDEVEAAASANAGAITTLQKLVSDYEGEGAIKTAIEAAAAKGQTGINNAATAQDAADAAQADVDELAEVVNNTNTGLAKTKEIADGAASEASRLAAIVDTGDNANSKLRSDITTLQANYLSKTDVNILGIYAVAFDLSTYSGNLEDEDDFKTATSRPIVFISGCSKLPTLTGCAWFDGPNEDARVVTDANITTNIILYLKEISIPEEVPEDT